MGHLNDLKYHTKIFNLLSYEKVSAVRVLSSSSGVAKEDNIEERENSEVKQFFGGQNDGLRVTDYRLRKDRQMWKLK